MQLPLGYPAAAEEVEILRRFRGQNPLETLAPATSAAEIVALQQRIRTVHVSAAVEDYVVAIARATRHHAEIELGASPRASLGIYHSAQAFAAIHGRTHVLPDDVKVVAPYVLPHRLITTAQARLRERGSREIIQEILKSVPAPVEAE
jgi:MoxR-like ATPase